MTSSTSDASLSCPFVDDEEDVASSSAAVDAVASKSTSNVNKKRQKRKKADSQPKGAVECKTNKGRKSVAVRSSSSGEPKTKKKKPCTKDLLSRPIPEYDEKELEDELWEFAQDKRKSSVGIPSFDERCPSKEPVTTTTTTTLSMQRNVLQKDGVDSNRLHETNHSTLQHEKDVYDVVQDVDLEDNRKETGGEGGKQEEIDEEDSLPAARDIPVPLWWQSYMDGPSPALDEICEMVSSLSSVTGRKAKLEKLLQFPSCVKVHLYVFNPFWQYYVRPTRVKKILQAGTWKIPSVPLCKDLFSLLDMLKNREIAGNQALYAVCMFISVNCRTAKLSPIKQKEHEQLVYSMLDRNLKIGCAEASINAVFPNLIPTFPVALANDIADVPANYLDYSRDVWLASRKFDGVRVLVFVKRDVVECRSRSGMLLPPLKLIENHILSLNLLEAPDDGKAAPTTQSASSGCPDMVLDGEVCVFDDGVENFQQAVGEVKRKSGLMDNARLRIFDFLTMAEFAEGALSPPYRDRMARLTALLKDKPLEPCLAAVECIRVEDESHLTLLVDNALSCKWEGLILRKNEPYVGKRSNDMLKVKKFKDGEFLCTGVALGMMKLPGEPREVETMSSITVDFNGNPVRVGGGFTAEQRHDIKRDPRSVIGKQVCVKYFQVSSNSKTGAKSLRFPIFKGIYGKERTV